MLGHPRSEVHSHEYGSPLPPGAPPRLRRGWQRSLIVASVGISSQLLGTLYIVAILSPERLAATAQLLGVPLGCSVLAGLNLWLWRSRRSINN